MCAQPTCVVMRMRTHHVVTIDSRKSIIVIAIVNVLLQYIALSILSLSPNVCMYVITLMMCVNTMCTCTVHVYVNKTSLEYSNYSVVQQYIEQ